jgi:TolA-binding protein
LSLNLKTADYALYQKAIIAGAQNKNADKLSLLNSLLQRFSTSSYTSDANIEIANAYLADEKYNEAIPPLQAILKLQGAQALYPQAYLKTGVAYFNLNKNEEALSNFTYVVKQYPNSQESDEAIDYIRNIFIENQKPSEFVAFMQKNGKNITTNEADSLTYKSAYLRYEAKDFSNALTGFSGYLATYPEGKYAIEANYYAAEISLVNKNAAKAAIYYAEVAAKAPNKYAERSTLQVARVHYFDLKDYANAEKYYILLKNIATQQENKLEAMRGLLRCQYRLQKWKEAVPNAQDLLQDKASATDDKMIANMVVAKKYQADSVLDKAATYYEAVAALGKSEYGAEAMYRIAEILLQQNNLSAAEKAAFDVIKKMGSYEFWVTKSYLLLGDVYVQQKDMFNAEATFKSIAENATIAELKQLAEIKLAQVIGLKNNSNKVEPQQ